MDMSNAFDCVPHDLFIAKLHAYGFETSALKFILSYLSNRHQFTRINGIDSLYELIVSQGSILGPIIFNIFSNDLFLFIKQANIHNYVDDTTLTTFSISIPNLIKTLENEAKSALLYLTLPYRVERARHVLTNIFQRFLSIINVGRSLISQPLSSVSWSMYVFGGLPWVLFPCTGCQSTKSLAS